MEECIINALAFKINSPHVCTYLYFKSGTVRYLKRTFTVCQLPVDTSHHAWIKKFSQGGGSFRPGVGLKIYRCKKQYFWKIKGGLDLYCQSGTRRYQSDISTYLTLNCNLRSYQKVTSYFNLLSVGYQYVHLTYLFCQKGTSMYLIHTHLYFQSAACATLLIIMLARNQ